MLLCLVSPVSAQLFKREKPYADGSTIEITGVVSDLQGQPIPDMTVELIAKRLKRLGGAVVREVSVTTRTNERGEYSFDWVWYRYYNDFLLEASLAVPTGGTSARYEVVAQTKLNNRIELGSPVIVPITITESEFLETFRSFLLSLDTDDERRVYDTQGRPDKVDVFERPDRLEEAWWYFDRGNVYRFVDGRLDQVESFDPIQP